MQGEFPVTPSDKVAAIIRLLDLDKADECALVLEMLNESVPRLTAAVGRYNERVKRIAAS